MEEDKNVKIENEGEYVKPEGEAYVSKEEFDDLKKDMTKSFAQIIELVKSKPEPEKTEKQKIEDKKVKEADTNVSEKNPRYEAIAREILGDKLERTFEEYPKGGGVMFTVSITKEASNAGDPHWEFYKHDYRTVNLEREEFRGEEGVTKWCKLIRDNLMRPAK